MRGLRITFVLASVAVFSTGFGSCSRSVATACRSDIPGFESRIAEAHAQLVPDRAVASEAGYKLWEDWAVERLKEVQRYHDIVEDEPKLAAAKRDLSETATQLVAFYGYARKGQHQNMSRAMAQIREHTERARNLACPAAGN